MRHQVLTSNPTDYGVMFTHCRRMDWYMPMKLNGLGERWRLF